MDINKLVSVVMCVFNTKQEYLDKAVESILNQTYKNIELIIIDDCSTNNLYLTDIYRDKRITVFRNEVNKRPSFSRNLGIDHAKGDYIAFMNSDDISSLERIEKQVRFFELNSDYVACSSYYKEFQNRNREIKNNIV